MNPNIDTADFTEKQQVVFLSTSVKSLCKLLRKTILEKAELETENEHLTKKVAYKQVHINRLEEQARKLRRENRKLKK